jgi:hypothetical protein
MVAEIEYAGISQGSPLSPLLYVFYNADLRTGQLLDGPKEKWKPDLAVVKATIRFLEKTGRLTYQQEVIQVV